MEFHIGIPQAILVTISIISMGIEIERHGKEQTGKHDFGVYLIASVITYSLLYWGGFFTK